MFWLGEKRGELSDWTTQQWVRATGRRLELKDNAWLDGPVGGTRRIGTGFFADYAGEHHLEIFDSSRRGLIPDFSVLEKDNPEMARVAQPVREFYEQTSEFDLDMWSQWHGLFRPFGKALSVLFSRRLQQLNVPLSAMDSSRGMTSSVVELRDRESGQLAHTAWIRELKATGNVVYAGAYSACRIPGHPNPCVKVVFPLPNGNAIVVMKAECSPDGGLCLRSHGGDFGEPGFYFTVQDGNGIVRARYLKSMQEEIRVYAAETGTVRADHTLWIWGAEFLRLHYRTRKTGSEAGEMTGCARFPITIS